MRIFQNKIAVGVICIVIAAILTFFFCRQSIGEKRYRKSDKTDTTGGVRNQN